MSAKTGYSPRFFDFMHLTKKRLLLKLQVRDSSQNSGFDYSVYSVKMSFLGCQILNFASE